MRKILILLITASVLLSCKGMQSVYYYPNYPKPADYKAADLQANTTIQQLKALSPDGNPQKITKDLVLAAQVISTDRTGNVYRSLYVQDATGGIEIKIGTSANYNMYRPGQWLYIKCNNLSIASVNGSYQLGFASDDPKYPLAYIQVPELINSHILLGKMAQMPDAHELTKQDLSSDRYLQCFVRINNLQYLKKIFAILYLDRNNSNSRVFLSGNENYGINTWALSKQALIDHVNKGDFDSIFEDKSNDLQLSLSEMKSKLINNASPVTVSQYFDFDGAEIQVRTSGYARFADTSIPESVLKGGQVSFRGILTKYVNDRGDRTNYQLILLNADPSSVITADNSGGIVIDKIYNN